MGYFVDPEQFSRNQQPISWLTETGGGFGQLTGPARTRSAPIAAISATGRSAVLFQMPCVNGMRLLWNSWQAPFGSEILVPDRAGLFRPDLPVSAFPRCAGGRLLQSFHPGASHAPSFWRKINGRLWWPTAAGITNRLLPHHQGSHFDDCQAEWLPGPEG